MSGSSVQETYEQKRQEHMRQMQAKEEQMRQMFVQKVRVQLGSKLMYFCVVREWHPKNFM